jgi:multidrug efflux pump subunit AcrA (membrane-fusion protein)
LEHLDALWLRGGFPESFLGTSDDASFHWRQQFIRTGETRGDFVAITKGLKAGEQVASTGVFKLKNGEAVVIDNTMAPDLKLNPTPPNT